VGCSLQAPAYLRAAIDAKALGLKTPSSAGPTPARALFVPAFNEIAGYDIIKIARDPFSPISRCMKQDDAEIILADGTYIGPLAMLLNDAADEVKGGGGRGV